VCFCVSAQTQNTPNASEKTKRLIPHQICAMQIKFIPREREKRPTKQPKQGMCHNVALPFTLKKILRQKKNYGISNISPCKNILIFKNCSKRNPKLSRY
jgi:hypothetical protein